MKKEKPWMKYMVAAMIGCLIVLLVLWSDGVFRGDLTELERTVAFADAFFTAGVLIAGIGLLVFVSSEGGLDGIGYGSRFVLLWILGKRDMETYKDYRLRKGKEKRASGGFLVLVGLVFLAVSGIFTVQFFWLDANTGL